MTLQDLMSTADLADLLGLEEQTLRKRRLAGRPMPPGRLIGPTWVYCRAEVEAWLRQGGDKRKRAVNGSTA
jgi:Helix-turn-helix domain